MKRLATAAVLLAMLQAGCYNTHQISKDELSQLQSGEERATVEITSVEGDEIEISAETPLEVQANERLYRVTPFNFLLSETQLVSPDYDLLLNAAAVDGAQVRELSYGKTFGLLGGVAAAVAAGFVVLTLTN